VLSEGDGSSYWSFVVLFLSCVFVCSLFLFYNNNWLKVLYSYLVTALSKFALLRYLSEIRVQVLDSDLSAIYP